MLLHKRQKRWSSSGGSASAAGGGARQPPSTPDLDTIMDWLTSVNGPTAAMPSPSTAAARHLVRACRSCLPLGLRWTAGMCVWLPRGVGSTRMHACCSAAPAAAHPFSVSPHWHGRHCQPSSGRGRRPAAGARGLLSEGCLRDSRHAHAWSGAVLPPHPGEATGDGWAA
jgi:hypothetical protein